MNLVAKNIWYTLIVLLCFSVISSCTTNLIKPNIKTGIAVAQIRLPIGIVKTFSSYSNNCIRDCLQFKPLSFETISTLEIGVLKFKFSIIKEFLSNQNFKRKVLERIRLIDIGLNVLEKNYSDIYESSAFPVTIKMHFVPENFDAKELMFEEISFNRSVFHFFTKITNDDLEENKLITEHEKTRRHLDIIQLTLEPLAHELSHIAQHNKNYKDAKFPLNTANDEARAKAFAFLFSLTYARRHTELTGQTVSLKVKKYLEGQGLNHDNHLSQILHSKTLDNGKVVLHTVSAENTYRGYLLGSKYIISLLGGTKISSSNFKLIEKIIENMRNDIRHCTDIQAKYVKD